MEKTKTSVNKEYEKLIDLIHSILSYVGQSRKLVSKLTHALYELTVQKMLKLSECFICLIKPFHQIQNVKKMISLYLYYFGPRYNFEIGPTIFFGGLI